MMTILDQNQGHEPFIVSHPILVIEKYFLIHRVLCFAHTLEGDYCSTCACGRRFSTVDSPTLTELVTLEVRCDGCWVTHRRMTHAKYSENGSQFWDSL